MLRAIYCKISAPVTTLTNIFLKDKNAAEKASDIIKVSTLVVNWLVYKLHFHHRQSIIVYTRPLSVASLAVDL